MCSECSQLLLLTGEFTGAQLLAEIWEKGNECALDVEAPGTILM